MNSNLIDQIKIWMYHFNRSIMIEELNYSQCTKEFLFKLNNAIKSTENTLEEYL